jgi:hypothetical protein
MSWFVTLTARGCDPRAKEDSEQAAARRHQARLERKLRRDLKLLALFVRVFCDGQHATAERAPLKLSGYWNPTHRGRPLELCEDCRRLLTHAIVKRTRCPLDPKPMCRHCPVHCYGPGYRDAMRAVMRYSGKRMILRGRLDYLLHLLF